MAIERKVEIQFQVTGADRAAAQVDRVDTSLEGVEASGAKAQRGLNAAASGADKAGTSFAQMGEGMEKSLKGVDSTFKGFDRLNGILGQLKNAAALLSGVAFIDLGKSFIDLARKASGAESALKGIARGIAQTKKETEAFKRSLDSFTGAGGLAGIYQVPPEALNQYIELSKGIAGVEAQLTLALKTNAEYSAGLKQLEVRQAAAVQRMQETAGASENARRLALASFAAVSGELAQFKALGSAASGSIIGLASALQRLGASRDKLTGDAAKAAGIGVKVGKIDTPSRGDVEAALAGLSAPFAAGSFGFDDGGDLSNASKQVEVLTNSLDSGIKATWDQYDALVALNDVSRKVSEGAGAVGGAVGSMSNALKAAGIESAALEKLIAVSRAALAGADALKEYAAGTAAAAALNPVLAAAHFTAAAAYTVAAGAYGAVAAGAGGGGGSSPSASPVSAPPSRSDFGSSSGGSDGDTYTINVSAGQTLSTSQDIERAIVDGLSSALGRRGSGARRRLRLAGA